MLALITMGRVVEMGTAGPSSLLSTVSSLPVPKGIWQGKLRHRSDDEGAMIPCLLLVDMPQRCVYVFVPCG